MDLKKTNSAVIKSMLMRMDKDTFIKNAKLIKKEYLGLIPNFYNQNYERKLWLLYQFSAQWYQRFWCKKNR